MSVSETSNGAAAGESERVLIKTLTFGLGTVHGFVDDMPVELEEEQRKRIYICLNDASRTLAQIVNVMVSRRYAREVLNVKAKVVEEFTPNVKAIVARLEGAKALSSYATDEATTLAKSHFSSEHGMELLVKGTRALSTHRTDGTHPICIRARGADLIRHGDKYFLCGGVFRKEWTESEGLPNWVAFPIVAKPRDKTLREQLDRIVSCEWELKNIRFARRAGGGRKWIGQVVVGYTARPNPKLSTSVVMGIDRGVTNPLTVNIRRDGKSESWARRIGNGRALLDAKFQIRRQIVALLRMLRRKDSIVTASQKENAQEKLRALRQQERNWVKTASRKVAAQLGEIARREGAGLWQAEKLGAEIKEESWLARNWPTAVLLDAIRWQAKQVGAELVEVDPRYTSQRCSKCGHIDRANRPKGKKGAAHFLCVKCGNEENADKNASRNLSDPEIESKITKWLEENPKE